MKKKIVSNKYTSWEYFVQDIEDFICSNIARYRNYEKYTGFGDLEFYNFRTQYHINEAVEWLIDHPAEFEEFCRKYNYSEDDILNLQD